MKTGFAMASAALVTATLVTACGGGSADTAASSGDPGAVAATTTCAPGPPAAAPLSITDYSDDNDYDGFVGAIYNDTDQPMWAWLVTGNTENAKCQVPAKSRAAYAVSLPSDIETYIRVAPLGDQQPYANLRIVDPDIGTASWKFSTPVNPYKSCGTVTSSQNQNFTEGSRQDNLGEGNGQGRYVIERFNDDDKIARQWTGVDDWKVDDWARADFTVKELPYC